MPAHAAEAHGAVRAKGDPDDVEAPRLNTRHAPNRRDDDLRVAGRVGELKGPRDVDLGAGGFIETNDGAEHDGTAPRRGPEPRAADGRRSHEARNSRCLLAGGTARDGPPA